MKNTTSSLEQLLRRLKKVRNFESVSIIEDSAFDNNRSIKVFSKLYGISESQHRHKQVFTMGYRNRHLAIFPETPGAPESFSSNDIKLIWKHIRADEPSMYNYKHMPWIQRQLIFIDQKIEKWILDNARDIPKLALIVLIVSFGLGIIAGLFLGYYV